MTAYLALPFKAFIVGLPLSGFELLCHKRSPLPRPAYVNCVRVRGGRVAAVCSCCGRRSRSTKPDKDGEPSMWEMGRGWCEAPYPHDFRHDDGSVGSMFTCPSCNKRLAAGETLRLRAYDAPARFGTVRNIT